MVNSGPAMLRIDVRAESGTSSPSVVAHVELAEVLDVGAVIAFGLDVDLPLAAEAVEVVDEGAAHEALQGLVNVLEIDPLLEHLVAVHIHEDLRHGRAEGGASRWPVPGACAPPRGTCWSARRERRCPCRRGPRRMKVTPPEVPTPGMAGGGKAKPMAPGIPASSLREFGLDGAVLLLGLLALATIPRG